jgi:pimeloyl-ACP methyl ester carboxylesterase
MQETTVEIRDLRVRMLQGGDGPPLLFLHGFNGPHWSPLLDRLSAHYRVLAPEHPGFGRSAIPDWMQGIGDLALFYLDVLEALDLRDVHLVGHAVGGWIAAELAVRNTSRLATLSLLAPAGIVVPGVSIADVFLIPTDDLVHRQVHDAEAPGAAEWIRTASAMEIDLVLENRAALARIGWSPRLHNPQLPFWLHRIDVPALVAWGQALSGANPRLRPPRPAGERTRAAVRARR